MHPSRRLRDVPESCYRPTNIRGQPGIPGRRRDACAVLEREQIRGSVDMLEEPMLNIDKFLSDDPNRHRTEDVLNQYRAFVVELAILASDITPEEQAWIGSLGVRAKRLAQEKFKKLKRGQSKICPLLAAYREAVNRLERYLRRGVEQPGIVNQRMSASSSSGFLDVGKIVSSGIEMLFGDSEDDAVETSPQTFGWVSINSIVTYHSLSSYLH